MPPGFILFLTRQIVVGTEELVALGAFIPWSAAGDAARSDDATNLFDVVIFILRVFLTTAIACGFLVWCWVDKLFAHEASVGDDLSTHFADFLS